MSVADGDDEDLWGLKVLSSDKVHLLQVLKIMFFKKHGETRVQFTEH